MSRQRKGIALCTPYEEKHIDPTKQYYIDPKFNGVRCLATIEKNGEIHLRSSTQKLKSSAPHINVELEKVKDWFNSEILPITLDGELYIHGESFQKINSIASRTVNLHPDYKQLDFYIFDIIIPGMETSLTQLTRYCYLSLISNEVRSEHLKFVTDYNFEKSGREILDNLTEITSVFYNEGYEGIVIKEKLSIYEKKRLKTWLKFKPTKTDVYSVLEAKEEYDKNGNPKDSLGALKVSGKVGPPFWVGSGFTKKKRKSIWEFYKETNTLPSEIIVKYQELSDNGTPIFPIIIEEEYA